MIVIAWLVGYHVTGTTGTLFLYVIVTGALAMVGLSMLLAGARRTSRRGREAPPCCRSMEEPSWPSLA